MHVYVCTNMYVSWFDGRGAWRGGEDEDGCAPWSRLSHAQREQVETRACMHYMHGHVTHIACLAPILCVQLYVVFIYVMHALYYAHYIPTHSTVHVQIHVHMIHNTRYTIHDT